MALEFVCENIKAFQGDPDHIPLGGDGAGAASVGFHLISDMTRNKGIRAKRIKLLSNRSHQKYKVNSKKNCNRVKIILSLEILEIKTTYALILFSAVFL